MTKYLTGACHCGAIDVALKVEDDTPLSPRHCGCSFCQKHGSLYISVPSGRLTIALTEPDRVSRYSFGHETASFLVCGRCGVVAAAVCEMEGRLHAVLQREPAVPAARRRPGFRPHRGLRGGRMSPAGSHAASSAGFPTSPSSRVNPQILSRVTACAVRKPRWDQRAERNSARLSLNRSGYSQNIMWPPKASTREFGQCFARNGLAVSAQWSAT